MNSKIMDGLLLKLLIMLLVMLLVFFLLVDILLKSVLPKLIVEDLLLMVVIIPSGLTKKVPDHSKPTWMLVFVEPPPVQEFLVQ